MKMAKSLLNKTVMRLSGTILATLLLCAPVFYFLTIRFYAEDLIMVVNDYNHTGRIDKDLDLEEDVVEGLMLQYVLITVITGTAVVITTRYMTRRLWEPFYDTLDKIGRFRLGTDGMPCLMATDTKEFVKLNKVIKKLLKRNIDSYRAQKEFNENASHELQTPIAIIRADLDLLLQGNLQQREYEIVNDMYNVTKRMEHLNRSLLMLARIENNQYEETGRIAIGELTGTLIQSYSKIYPNSISLVIEEEAVVNANRQLAEVLVNNLTINALRNSEQGKSVTVRVRRRSLTVSNFSQKGELDGSTLFCRFGNSARNSGGNGMGLAIVKQICDLYNWNIDYSYSGGAHSFCVSF